jgi:hypothetical protein
MAVLRTYSILLERLGIKDSEVPSTSSALMLMSLSETI